MGFGRPTGTVESEGKQGAALANFEKLPIDFIDQSGDVANPVSEAARLLAATNLCHAIAECEPEDAAFILAGVLAELSAGPPPPPLMGVMDEARSWADFASSIELRAYAVACFLRLPPKVQAEFLTWARPHVSGGAR